MKKETANTKDPEATPEITHVKKQIKRHTGENTRR
jgi:hypothetical protein